MRDFKDYFKDKKITVLGLGLLGRGVGDTAFLAECGAELIVTDLKSKEALKESLEKLSGFANIKYTLGEHRMEDFVGRDLILVAPSVPLDSPFVAHGVASGARKVQSAALFAELSGIPIIGVTGTRGKSTTSQMIHHALQFVTGEEILLGGTVRGVSNLQLLRNVKEDSIAVFELDSWQLQGWGWAGMSPHIAVFTNFMEDHMNYYQGDMDAYFNDKAHIFLHQEESGVFITTPEVFERAKEFAKGKRITLGQEVLLVDSSILPEDCLLSQPGEHNRLNAALATEALRATGLTDEEIFHGLATFPGVPGRLEYLGEKNGIRIYNDNNATTPQATIQGITAVARGKNVILIAGGSYKEVDPSPLVSVMDEFCKAVVLIPGTGTDKLKETVTTLRTGIPIDWNTCPSLAEAVETGLAKGESGDVLLFSPAFASFGMFKNEYERNDEFCRIIGAIE